MNIFGVDIGGSGVKGAPVETRSGDLIGDRVRIKTPQPSTPAAVAEAVWNLADEFGWSGPAGVAIPAVVRHGVVTTASNIDESWIGTDAAALFGERFDGVTVLNDADAAGLAEVRLGAGRDVRGLVVLLTFGTGIGSAVINEGRLVPNTELGHLEFHGAAAEDYAASRLVETKKTEGISTDEWIDRVNEYLAYVENLLWPDLFIIGGGISKRFEVYADLLVARTDIVPAVLRNNAGIVGAALAAAEEETHP